MTKNEFEERKKELFKNLETIRINIQDDFIFIFLLAEYTNSKKSLKKVTTLFKEKKFCKDFIKELKNKGLN